MSFVASNLPEWDAFCAEGEGARTCDFAMGDLWCIEAIQLISDSLNCQELWRDSLTISYMESGTTTIEQKDYAYLRIEGDGPTGLMESETYFYGCAGVKFETCTTNSDTTICQRSVLETASYADLEFVPLWECGMELPLCMSATSEVIEKDILLFPNPVNDRLYFDAEDRIVKQVQIYDAQGKQRSRMLISDSHSNIDVSTLDDGIYFLKVDFVDGSSASSKIMKQ